MKKILTFVKKFIVLGGKHFIIPTIACTMAIFVSFHFGLILLNQNSNDQIKIEIDSCDINRQFIKSEIISEVSSYIETYAPNSEMSPKAIVEKCLDKDYVISLLLAQAHIESHFGTKGRAKRTNSVFGIRAYDDGTNALFYATPNDAIDHYIEVMNNYYLKDNPPLEVLKRGLTRGNARYASDPSYEIKIITKINQINGEYHIDKLQEMYQDLKEVKK